jgi:hypothetical protein
VHPLTLTGLSERSHLLNAGVNLETHIQEVVSMLASLLQPIRLTGAGTTCTRQGATASRRGRYGSRSYARSGRMRMRRWVWRWLGVLVAEPASVVRALVGG